MMGADATFEKPVASDELRAAIDKITPSEDG
jgi:DNA-binding response OmpR family regulator